MSGTATRLKSASFVNDNEQAHVDIDVVIQSMSFPPKSTSGHAPKEQYLETMASFNRILSLNRDQLRGRVTALLARNYMCTSVTVHPEVTSLRLEIHLPVAKQLALQCDQSSGQLAEDIQACIVTTSMLKNLNVEEMTLSTELVVL